jgi:hypothetical protein
MNSFIIGLIIFFIYFIIGFIFSIIMYIIAPAEYKEKFSTQEVIEVFVFLWPFILISYLTWKE